QGAAGSAVAGDTAKRAELARQAYEKTLADMKDLAEIARKSQADAMASITQRATQHMEELKKMMQPK
ncbi:MAG TPA: TIGR01841 family phasin, partial [Candidimonas sp.]|nr:TIGR01841 family phasin [Candidimonas sp.]